MLDINNDCWLDIYVAKAGSMNDDEGRRNKLFVNQKDGTFKEEGKKWEWQIQGILHKPIH
jgi:hypothetical protein